MAKKQPILVHDVAQCILNALKLPETCGRTYDLGGPNELTMLEIYELMSNLTLRPPHLVHVNHDWAVKTADKLVNWTYLSKEYMLKHKTDLIVDPNARKIDELCVQPVSFNYGVKRFIHENKARY